MTAHDLRAIADAILDKKGTEVASFDFRKSNGAIADYFMICSASNTTQVAAVADHVMERMREEGRGKPLRTQGLENNMWVILDYGDIIVHIFLDTYRAFYHLEELWPDIPTKAYKRHSRKASAQKEASTPQASSL